jgi:dihydroxyacetone kinase-like protein
MSESFPNSEGSGIVRDLIAAINENKQYLSDIDGQIGDGDHGINMAKGFNQTASALEADSGDLTHSLRTLGKILMTNIGGSMGPLYGMFFRSAAKAADGEEHIDREVFGQMLDGILEGITKISQAKVGDKTLMDALIPAVEAYKKSAAGGASFAESLRAMARAAEAGRDSTKDMVAKVGRSSRLGERSRGVLDAGATSCALILTTMAASIGELLAE